MAQRTLLLDTNILLCALISPEKLSAGCQAQLTNSESEIYFSAVSIWEIAIKASLNKADFNFSPQDIHALALQTGFSELPMQANHTYAVTTLPWHHRDPFDRLLIAQALALPAYFMTSDAQLQIYSELIQLVNLK